MAFIKKKKKKHHTNNIYQYTVFNSNLFTSNAIENCLLTHTNTHTNTHTHRTHGHPFKILQWGNE